ncbi:MAG: sulfatase-like hydrolase/transferase [Bacteroidales bacterium]|nr:sulfatase-like hydrolase/transferase [Bacteroidales bacterium]
MKEKISLLLLVSVSCSHKTADAPKQDGEFPNIILLMADDLGYGDLGCYGNPTVKSPNLDMMAREGIRFNRFYSAAPVSSPTRGSCLTGRHPFRYGVLWAGREPLPDDEITLAEALKSKGYETGHFGKWHLGGLSRTVIQGEFPGGPSPYSPPWENGFDECFSTESMVPNYNPYYHVGGRYGTEGYRQVQTEPVARDQRTGGAVWTDRYWTGPGQVVDEWLEGDDSEIIMDRAIDFIHRKTVNKTPFLAVIWFHTPHTPVVAGNEYRNLYPDQPMEKQHWFGAITAMDDQIGRLRSYLRDNGIARNTIIWFCSDNGPSYIHNYNSAGPLRGKKSELYEGGIRVPAILEWPAMFTEPMTFDIPVSTSDFYPTLLAVTNTVMENQPPLDGENILPLLEGKSDRRGPIGFMSPLPSPLRKQETRVEEQFALVDRQYKIISMDNGITYQLYNLITDEGETTDISNEQPDLFNDMKSKLLKWVRACRNDSILSR